MHFSLPAIIFVLWLPISSLPTDETAHRGEMEIGPIELRHADHPDLFSFPFLIK